MDQNESIFDRANDIGQRSVKAPELLDRRQLSQLLTDIESFLAQSADGLTYQDTFLHGELLRRLRCHHNVEDEQGNVTAETISQLLLRDRELEIFDAEDIIKLTAEMLSLSSWESNESARALLLRLQTSHKISPEGMGSLSAVKFTCDWFGPFKQNPDWEEYCGEWISSNSDGGAMAQAAERGWQITEEGQMFCEFHRVEAPVAPTDYKPHTAIRPPKGSPGSEPDLEAALSELFGPLGVLEVEESS